MYVYFYNKTYVLNTLHTALQKYQIPLTVNVTFPECMNYVSVSPTHTTYMKCVK